MNVGAHSSDCLYEFSNPPDTSVPIVCQSVKVHPQPAFHRGQAADDLFLAYLHRTANRAFPGIGVGQRGLDQVLASQQQATALRSHKPLATAEGVQICPHPRVEFDVVNWRDSGCVIEKQGDSSALRYGYLLGQVLTDVGGVYHCAVRVECVL